MLCSKCFQPCTKCGTKWNRDINVAKNVLYIGRSMLLATTMNRDLPQLTFSFPHST